MTQSWVGQPPRMTVSLFNPVYQRLGQVPNYESCSVTWQYLGVGTGELVVGEDDPVAQYLLLADTEVLPVTVEVNGVRWSGRVASATLERQGPVGSGTITASLVDDTIWLQRMLASPNGASTSLTSLPKADTRTGPVCSVAADYINAAASRLSVPVKASKPSTDTSMSVTLNARMTPLSDLLTLPLVVAGATMAATVWLPGDPFPTNLTSLSTPTIVFAPLVPADKPWLQWTEKMTNIDKLTLQANQPDAYRAIIGLGGSDTARPFDQYIDTTKKTAVGSYGLPEIYTDASDVSTVGTASQAAGRNALSANAGTTSAVFEISDGNPFIFGKDYLVGDKATLVVAGGTWRQRITKVTASDDRSGGLSLSLLVGDDTPDATGDVRMVQALQRVAAQLRTLQAGR